MICCIFLFLYFVLAAVCMVARKTGGNLCSQVYVESDPVPISMLSTYCLIFPHLDE